jgi:hypothetical protein
VAEHDQDEQADAQGRRRGGHGTRPARIVQHRARRLAELVANGLVAKQLRHGGQLRMLQTTSLSAPYDARWTCRMEMRAETIECEPIAWKSNDAFRAMLYRRQSRNGQPVRVMHRIAPRYRRAKCPATDLRSVEDKKIKHSDTTGSRTQILSSAAVLFASSRQKRDTITPQAGPLHERGAGKEALRAWSPLAPLGRINGLERRCDPES